MNHDVTADSTNRRRWLQTASLGFGIAGLAGLFQQLQAAELSPQQRLLQPHFVPRAKRVILLFMNGGPSHVDTFDPKPALATHAGQKPSEKETRRAKAGYMPSPFRFLPHGSSGVVMSELFPHLSQCADDLCVIRSMHTDVPNHEPGLIIMHSGVQQPTRPSIGSWVTYGLGTENQNLPGYVVLGPRRPVVGPHLIQAMEVAFSMQMEASAAFDISQETQATRDLYGNTLFGRQCLLARRLSERGVRFVTSYYLTPGGNQPWDTHTNNDDGHRKLCADSDRATAALLTDLKQRGLLEDTLVIWTGEFGRTPYAQPNDKGKQGRDHHHSAFTTVLAGGGVKGGLMYGASDELGMFAVENRVHVHDLHATVLHLLGIDHEQLTYRYSGRDFRLTDVHGQVVQGILA